MSLTLDSNIQQRTEQVLAAVARVFEPERRHRDRDGPPQRRTARRRQLAPGQRQRPRRVARRARSRTAPSASTTNRARPSRSSRSPGGPAAGADHPEQRVHRAGSDPGRRPDDPRRHRTRRGNALGQRNPGPLEQRRRDRDRQSRGRGRLQRLGAPVRLRTPARGPVSPAKNRAWCCRWSSTPAPRWATCRSARASW